MKVLLICLSLLTFSTVRTQDIDSTVTSGNNFYRTSLNDARDTLDVTFNSRFDYYTVTATAGQADTIAVYTLARDGDTWSQHGLTDLASGSAVTQAVCGTTAKEFRILDPQPKKLRFIVTDADTALITVVVQGKIGKL